MLIKEEQVKSLLYNKAIPGNLLQQETGVSRQAIARVRRGGSDFDNLTLATVKTLQKYIDDGNYHISYDYDDLIEDFEEDTRLGDVGQTIFAVRGPFHETLGHKPLVDYYLDAEEVDFSELEDGETIEYMKTDDFYKELKSVGSILGLD